MGDLLLFLTKALITKNGPSNSFALDAGAAFRRLNLPTNIEMDELKRNPFMMDAAEINQKMTTIEPLAALLKAAHKKPKAART